MREQAKAQKIITKIGTRFIEEKKAAVRREMSYTGSLEKKDIQGSDLLTLLLRANMASDLPENARLSDTDIVSQVPTFLIAGVCHFALESPRVCTDVKYFSTKVSSRTARLDATYV